MHDLPRRNEGRRGRGTRIASCLPSHLPRRMHCVLASGSAEQSLPLLPTSLLYRLWYKNSATVSHFGRSAHFGRSTLYKHSRTVRQLAILFLLSYFAATMRYDSRPKEQHFSTVRSHTSTLLSIEITHKCYFITLRNTWISNSDYLHTPQERRP